MSATDAAAAFPYAVHLDIKFDALDLIDVPSLVEACTDQWYNQTHSNRAGHAEPFGSRLS